MINDRPLNLIEKLLIKSQIAKCYFKLRDIEKAYSYIKDVIVDSPKLSADILDDHLKFLCEIQLNMLEESKITFKEAQHLYPNHPNLKEFF